MLKVLFIGDIVGKKGREALYKYLPFLKENYDCDLVIVNGENSAHGKGITPNIYRDFIAAGVDCITLGNHAFSKSCISDFIGTVPNLIRPENMMPLNIGKSCCIKEINGTKIGIFNIYGSVFMENCTESPFISFQRMLLNNPCDIHIVDFHAEATGEKYGFMRYFQNDCQLIVGTHTHIQTADEDIYNGCGFICDVGMCGPYDSVLGRDTEETLKRFTENINTRYQVSESEAMLCAVYAEIDCGTKKCTKIERIQLRP
ncbi:MAG: TIGR00282 family metallophosphoesterase [Erysipelotrichia bacterium]|nr:TIGR00282 family metallophosphoesterase [Erysipelotrichia bacterium]